MPKYSDTAPVEVSIIIPTHNRSAKLRRLLESIGQAGFSGSAYEVIVVADHCTDDTESMIKNEFDSVVVVRQSGDEFGCGVARINGLNVAKAEIVFFIDDDNILGLDCLAILIGVMAIHPRIGVLGPLMFRFPETHEVWCAGAVLDRFGRSSHRSRGNLPIDSNDPELLTPCDYLPNAFMVRRSLLDSTSGGVAPDTRHFPHNWSEFDFMYQITKSGYEVRVATNATVYHDVGYRGPFTRTGSPQMVFDQQRSRLLLRRKYPERFVPFIVYALVMLVPSTVLYVYRFLHEKDTWAKVVAYIKGALAGLTEDVGPEA